MSFRKGAAVWVEDKDLAWVPAEVADFVGKQVHVLTSTGKKVLASPDALFPRDPEADLGGVDDMTKLTYLNEPGVLYNLEKRYALDSIYTYTGSILIAVNPFTKLPHLYDTHMMEQYKGAPFGELSPHVFAVADASYRAMINDGQSQSILVSGESGAGKTETTKLIMQYLTYVGGRASGDYRSVEQQVLESNPLLEAFGNARTARNDNSRCNVEGLRSSLCKRLIQTREGTIVKDLDCSAAIASRDALAKTVYARLFDWLVEKINRSVGQDSSSRAQIGLLDIYGFECFKYNRNQLE